MKFVAFIGLITSIQLTLFEIHLCSIYCFKTYCAVKKRDIVPPSASIQGLCSFNECIYEITGACLFYSPNNLQEALWGASFTTANATSRSLATYPCPFHYCTCSVKGSACMYIFDEEQPYQQCHCSRHGKQLGLSNTCSDT